jgi:hypothetical protein
LRDYYDFYIKNIGDDSKKLAFIVQPEDFVARNAKLGLQPKQLKERFIGMHFGISTAKNHFMFHLMNDVLDQLISGGIPQHLNEFHKSMQLWRLKRKYIREVDDQKSFTIDDLSYGFWIWLIASGISTAIFLVNVSKGIWGILKFKMEKFIGLFLVLNFLRRGI